MNSNEFIHVNHQPCTIPSNMNLSSSSSIKYDERKTEVYHFPFSSFQPDPNLNSDMVTPLDGVIHHHHQVLCDEMNGLINHGDEVEEVENEFDTQPNDKYSMVSMNHNNKQDYTLFEAPKWMSHMNGTRNSNVKHLTNERSGYAQLDVNVPKIISISLDPSDRPITRDDEIAQSNNLTHQKNSLVDFEGHQELPKQPFNLAQSNNLIMNDFDSLLSNEKATNMDSSLDTDETNESSNFKIKSNHRFTHSKLINKTVLKINLLYCFIYKFINFK